jgi:hypothetical protein
MKTVMIAAELYENEREVNLICPSAFPPKTHKKTLNVEKKNVNLHNRKCTLCHYSPSQLEFFFFILFTNKSLLLSLLTIEIFEISLFWKKNGKGEKVDKNFITRFSLGTRWAALDRCLMNDFIFISFFAYLFRIFILLFLKFHPQLWKSFFDKRT